MHHYTLLNEYMYLHASPELRRAFQYPHSARTVSKAAAYTCTDIKDSYMYLHWRRKQFSGGWGGGGGASQVNECVIVMQGIISNVARKKWKVGL